jgi:hypothetical protein
MFPQLSADCRRVVTAHLSHAGRALPFLTGVDFPETILPLVQPI